MFSAHNYREIRSTACIEEYTVDRSWRMWIVCLLIEFLLSSSLHTTFAFGSGSGSGYVTESGNSGSGFSGSGNEGSGSWSGSGEAPGSGSGEPAEIPEAFLSLSLSPSPTTANVLFGTDSSTGSLSLPLLRATPTPSAQPPEPIVPSVEQQEQASVVMVLKAVSLEQWAMDGGLLEHKFKNATAAAATMFCRAHPAKCGFSGTVDAAPRNKRALDSFNEFTSSDVLVLPGYPSEVNGGDLEVAYSIRMPPGSHAGTSMLGPDVLMSAALQFEQEMEGWMNVSIGGIRQYRSPSVVQLQVDEVAALSGALVPVGLAILVGIPATIIIIWRCRSYINHKKRTRRTVENNDVELTDVMDAREVY